MEKIFWKQLRIKKEKNGAATARTRFKQTLLQASNTSELLLMLHGGSMS